MINSRRKETLLKKAHEIGILCDVDVAVYLRYRKSGRLITYKSSNRRCWPPTEEQIVSALEHLEHHANTLQEHTYPIPLVLLPEDMEARFGKVLDTTMEDKRGLGQSSPDENHGSTQANAI
jgi:hypothetical protein